MLELIFGPVRNDDSQLSGCFDVYFENYCCWLSSLIVLLLPSFAYSHYVCWCIWYSVYTHHERKTSSKVENIVFLLNWLPKHTITTLTHTARISYARVHKHNHINIYTHTFTSHICQWHLTAQTQTCWITLLTKTNTNFCTIFWSIFSVFFLKLLSWIIIKFLFNNND